MTNTPEQQKILQLQEELSFNQKIDGEIEKYQINRTSLEGAIAGLLPLLAEKINADNIVLKTFSEKLQLQNFSLKGDKVSDLEKSEKSPYVKETPSGMVLGQSLIVAGEWFGECAVYFEQKLNESKIDTVLRLISIWCEELDNYLAGIYKARIKHAVIKKIADALTIPVLDDGIDKSIEILKENVNIDDMLLVFWDEGTQSHLHYKVVNGGELKFDSRHKRNTELESFLNKHWKNKSATERAKLPPEFTTNHHFEEELIYGHSEQQIIGRIVIGRKSSAFNTFDEDLLNTFSSHLRQRIVDFNKEWDSLSQSFSGTIIANLMAEENYKARYLMPKEKIVAIMYADISGFTRVSEQVLKQPELIGDLINKWSAKAVDIIWQSGGVFDKLVGDCIIGLWGPPFFKESNQNNSLRAIEAANAIRGYTSQFGNSGALDKLKGVEMGVSIGINICPLYVGFFGPNQDYTGFSSGMNNTARIQGVAGKNEILCMENVVEVMGKQLKFSQAREVQVKNVSEPLQYRQFLDFN